MNKYIIYTTEGFCQAPDGNDIENCQVLGVADGSCGSEAIENFLCDHQWVNDHGYDKNEFIVRRLHDSESISLEDADVVDINPCTSNEKIGMNIIELMIQYNLTLRRLPNCITTNYWLPSNPTEDEILQAQDAIIASSVSKEKYEHVCSSGGWNNSRYYNGFVIKKLVVKHKACEDGWLVKIDCSHNAMQQWSKKDNFFGKTPEEAIQKAIDYIQVRDAQLLKLKQEAGL